MGSKLGPSYACLFVGYHEHLIYSSYGGPFLCLIRRYIDDIVGATSLPLASLQNFNFNSHALSPNTVYPFLTSCPPSKTTLLLPLPFLRKQIHTAFLITFHPILKKCRNSIPYSQLRRLRCICSSNDDFHEKAKKMTSFFHNNHYPEKITTLLSLKSTTSLRMKPLNQSTGQILITV